MSEKEKYLQIRREAMWTGFALVILILFWLVAGFGMSHIDVKVFGLPVWAVTGNCGSVDFCHGSCENADFTGVSGY